ncbi:MAG: hypothetical protein MJE77_12265 [Proteobacteria bacterium]|nr:hypothetical protein [Pseudomonadota bacterium]
MAANKRKRGRPRATPDVDDFAGLRTAPRGDCLDLFEWLQRVLAVDAARIVRSRGTKRTKADTRLSVEIQRTAKSLNVLTDALLFAEAFEPGVLEGLDTGTQPPGDSVKMAAWYLLVLAEHIEHLVAGTIDEEFGRAIRTNLRAWADVLPPSVRVEAQRKLKASARGLAGAGPQLIPARRAARSRAIPTVH